MSKLASMEIFQKKFHKLKRVTDSQFLLDHEEAIVFYIKNVGETILSHVVGVLQIKYLLSCAGV